MTRILPAVAALALMGAAALPIQAQAADQLQPTAGQVTSTDLSAQRWHHRWGWHHGWGWSHRHWGWGPRFHRRWAWGPGYRHWAWGPRYRHWGWRHRYWGPRF